jgi:hypothetical protein
MTVRRGSRGQDVKDLQQFLIDEGILDDVADGVAGPKTEAAIKAFQKREGLGADGIAGPATLAAVRRGGPAKELECDGCGRPMPTPAESEELVAKKAGIPVDVLRAFKKTESGGRADAIRFEPHLFIKRRPDLTGSIPFTKGLKSFSVVRSETNKAAFDHAFSLDQDAAVRSTSWGLYQVLGGYLLKAYGSPETAVTKFYKNPELASDLTVAAWFNDSSSAVKAANELDWRTLARRYNGPGNVDNYSAKLKKNYESVVG